MHPEIKLSRRAFLELMTALAVEACAPKRDLIPQVETVQTLEITPLATKQEVRQLLAVLPESQYKDFVIGYAGALLADQPPSEITIGGLKIKVFGVEVGDSRWPMANRVASMGSASLRQGFMSPRHPVSQVLTFTAAFPHLVASAETKLVTIPFSAGTEFEEGIAPQISVLSPEIIPASFTGDYKDIREFVLIKESFSIAYIIAYLEAMINEMNKALLPLYIDNNGERLEAVCASYTAIQTTKGRLSALIDVGSLILAAKAAEPTKAQRIYAYYPFYKPLLTSITDIDFGRKSDLLRNSMNYIVANQPLVEIAKEGYTGDLQKPY